MALRAGCCEEGSGALFGQAPSSKHEVAADQVAVDETHAGRVPPALCQVPSLEHERFRLDEVSRVLQEAGEVHIAARELSEFPGSGRKLYAGAYVGQRGVPIGVWQLLPRRSERDEILRAEIISSERLGEPKTLLRRLDGSFLLTEE